MAIDYFVDARNSGYKRKKIKKRKYFNENEKLDIDTNLNRLETYSTAKYLIEQIHLCPKYTNEDESICQRISQTSEFKWSKLSI